MPDRNSWVLGIKTNQAIEHMYNGLICLKLLNRFSLYPECI